MTRGEIGERALRLPDAFERRNGCGEALDQHRGGLKLALGDEHARLGVMQVGALLAPQLAEFYAEMRERLGESEAARARPRPTQHRPLQGRDGARMRVFGGAEPQQRMLEQREQRDRRKPAQRRLRREPRERAGRGVCERIAAGVVDRHLPARERGDHAAGERTVGRHQRRRHVRRLHCFAQRDGDRERFLLGMRRLDVSERRERVPGMRGKQGSAEPLAPMLGRGRRPQRFRHEGFAAMRRGRDQRDDFGARHREAREQRLHRDLRMPEMGCDHSAGLGIAAAGDQVP